MESRLITGTARIPSLRNPPAPRQSPAPTCLAPAAKPIGAVADGGNLIWGRHLRPAILLHTSPLTKRHIPKPVPAAAASPPADSSGIAKVHQNPAIAAGFFFLLWYFFAVTFNILNKRIFNYFPYPYFVSVIHLFVGVVYCLASWSVSLPRRAPIDANLLKMLIPVAIWHALGHVATNVSIAAVAVSFTHTVKALEPFFNAVASQFILGQSIPFTLWLSLAPVVIGVSVASLTELSFNRLGFISAMISNISFTFRSLSSKKAMADMDGSNLYAYISIIALVVCIPPAIIVEGPQLISHGFNDAIAEVGMTKFISDLSLVGLLYHLYNQLAINALGRVAPHTHAVGNVLKRVLVIGFSVLVFSNSISSQTVIGTSVAIAGMALYSLFKAQLEQK